MSYRYCSACAKYIRKKEFKSHVKKHETGELTGDVAPEEDDNELDTSKDEDDDELIIEDEAVTEEAESPEIDTKKISTPNKIYNCVDCTRMFMSAEAHANHLRDVHGGEGGSIVLKLPKEKTIEKKVDYEEDMEEEDKADDELVIDDTQ